MFAVALSIELRIPDSHSLKEKRGRVKPIVEGLQRRFRVAAAEVDHHAAWQRAQLGVAAVGGSQAHVADVLDEVERFVWSFPEIEVLGTTRTWLEVDS